ncbi:MAG: hypothetical protein HY700_11985 [Gemmatimonadetes bacterium]|nr:hypothetical protein [Gemmatimonadota bacterium]
MNSVHRLPVALLLAAWACGGEPTPRREPVPGAESAPAAATAALLDPAPYRPPIAALEEILYKPEPTLADGDVAERRAHELSAALRGDGLDRTRVRAAGAVSELAGVVSAQMDVGYGGPNIPAWRTRWESIRSRTFADAAWFGGRGAGAPIVSGPARSVAAVDRAIVRDLNDLTAELQRAARFGQQQALAIPEPPAEGLQRTAQARQLESQWRTWADSWTHEIDGLARRYDTSIDPRSDMNLVLAGQELGYALNDLRMVTVTGASTAAFPMKYERRRRFESALDRVQKARDYLAKVGSP